MPRKIEPLSIAFAINDGTATSSAYAKGGGDYGVDLLRQHHDRYACRLDGDA